MTPIYLHHMLCKKVAQLTKVIFHLNSRNEDQEARLVDLHDQASAVQEAHEKLTATAKEADEYKKGAEKRLKELEQAGRAAERDGAQAHAGGAGRVPRGRGRPRLPAPRRRSGDGADGS